MKFAPKDARFCPGCPKKELKLIKEPTFVIEPPVQKQDTKRTTIISSKKTNNHKLFGLF